LSSPSPSSALEAHTESGGGGGGAPDNTQMMYLNEATLLDNLRLRFAADAIYTSTGFILIAVNPYRRLPIYSPETIELYASSHAHHNDSQQRKSQQPHVFAAADRAFRCMKSALSVRTLGAFTFSMQARLPIIHAASSAQGDVNWSICRRSVRLGLAVD
jgi:hypothetical protein